MLETGVAGFSEAWMSMGRTIRRIPEDVRVSLERTEIYPAYCNILNFKTSKLDFTTMKLGFNPRFHDYKTRFHDYISRLQN